MNRLFAVLAIFAITLFGLKLRLDSSQQRIAHADEGEQALTYLKLYNSGEYQYSPMGAHGSILYYWAYFVKKTESIFREPSQEISSLRLTLLPIFLLSILAFFALRTQLNFSGLAIAIFAWSASAISVLYSLYFVQEIFFALFVFLAISYLYLSIKRQKLGDFIAFGLACGFAQATKETFAIVLLALSLPTLILAYKEKLKLDFPLLKKLLLSLVCAFFVYGIFYSSFGANPRGIVDGISSYFHFFDKAQGDVHSKEFLYYAKLLLWQKSQGVYFGEFAITLFALLGAFIGLVKKNRLINYISSFCLLYFAILSLIPYKTPWLLLSLIMPMCVLFGYGFSWGLSKKSVVVKIILVFVLLATFVLQLKYTKLASQRFAMDSRNPLIYVHTLADLKNLLRRIGQVKEAYPDARINFDMQNSPFPIPYYLLKYKNISYNKDSENKNYQVIAKDEPIDENMESYQEEIYGLRENLMIYLYIDKNIFEEIIK